MLKSKDNLWESAFIFHHVGPWAWWQAPLLLTQLTCPKRVVDFTNTVSPFFLWFHCCVDLTEQILPWQLLFLQWKRWGDSISQHWETKWASSTVLSGWIKLFKVVFMSSKLIGQERGSHFLVWRACVCVFVYGHIYDTHIYTHPRLRKKALSGSI